MAIKNSLKSICSVAAVSAVAMAFGGVASAQASTVPLGSIDSGSYASINASGTAGKTISDSYAFSISTLSAVDVGYETTYLGGVSGYLESSNGSVITPTSTSTDTVGSVSVTDLSYADLLSGVYTFVFSGTVSGGHAKGGLTGSIAVSAVPLPASLPLFAAAIGGLFFFAGRRYRKVAYKAA